MRHLWHLLLNSLSLLLVATAQPRGQRLVNSPPLVIADGGSSSSPPSMGASATAANLWPLVNKTCLAPQGDCEPSISEQHLLSVRRNMNVAADPCEDFHAFACGGAGHPLGTALRQGAPRSTMFVANEQVTDNFVLLFERLLSEKRKRYAIELVDEPAGIEHERESDYRPAHTQHHHRHPHQHAQQQQQQRALPIALHTLADAEAVYEKLLRYYTLCKAATPAKGNWAGYLEVMQQARPDVWPSEGGRQHTGHLPGHASDQRTTFNWLAALSQVTSYGAGNFFLRSQVKQKNATYYYVHILPHDRRDEARLPYTAALYALLRPYTTLSSAEVRRQFEELEDQLLGIMKVACAGHALDAEGDCELERILTLAELVRDAPEVDWALFLGQQLGDIAQRPHIRFHVEDVASVRKIARLLNRSDPQTVRLYTLARFAAYVQRLPYNAVELGASPKLCICHIRKLFHQPMTYLYERAFYAQQRPASEPLIRSVFAQLKEEFARTLAANQLALGPALVAYLQRKLLALRLNVGNLPPGEGVHFFADYMRQFNMSAGANAGDSSAGGTLAFHAQHLLALQHGHAMQRSLAALQPGVDDDSPWHTISYHPPDYQDNIDSTAYYYCCNNMIILPHAYLQPPFFNPHFWPVFVYGDLANTLGHELIHAFDINFVDFDENGNYNRQILQELYANERYNRSLSCLAEGIRERWLSERIADVSGTRLALNTFLRSSQVLHNNGRLYFLQFAQFFCGTTDEATHQADDPDHDMDNLRLNYALANTPEFAGAYACRIGSAMNPEKRCEMW